MTRFRRLLPVFALGAALATAPAAADATYELHATARTAHGFSVTLRRAAVFDFGGPSAFDFHGQSVFDDYSGSVVVSRTVDGQTLSRTLEAAHPAKVTATRGLTRARVRLGFGSRGRVDLRFTPTGGTRQVGTTSCNAPMDGRPGVFKGTVRVRMGGVFATLRRTKLRGTIGIDAYGLDCADPRPMGFYHELSVAGAGLTGLFFDRGVGRVTRPSTRGKGWSQTDEIDVHRRRVFSAHVEGNPATATAHVQADGPFLTGSLDYGPQSGIVLQNQNIVVEGTFMDAPGPVAGSLTARFPGLGVPGATMRPTTGGLTQQCEQCM